MLPEFRNEPLTDFSLETHRSAFAAALARVEARLPIEGKNRIGGKEVCDMPPTGITLELDGEKTSIYLVRGQYQWVELARRP